MKEDPMMKLARRVMRTPMDQLPHNYNVPTVPLPPNTLRNSDGTPYSAGHDTTAREKLQEAIELIEQELPSVSKTTCEQFEKACKLVREALELM